MTSKGSESSRIYLDTLFPPSAVLRAATVGAKEFLSFVFGYSFKNSVP